ncbi:MAG: UvrD-helicase domain-containing protein [Dehalococcoidia bacterium]|nr:UvrD-helicase domain-containing protein [Dehalococcoidia bacterium]
MTTRDADARARIVEDLDSSLFVEAGAGTGKTTALVGRVTALLRRGVPVTKLVVITFTRAAAAELREKVRIEVTEARENAEIGSPEREYLDTAVREIDFAVIQTIDSFALSMLRERPLEAGLPPVIEPVDEVQAELNFDEAWSQWLDDQPDDGEFASAIAMAFRLGLRTPLADLYETTRRLHDNYHLVSEHDFTESGAIPRVAGQSIVEAGKWLPGMVRFCRLPEGDKLTASLEDFGSVAERLERVGPDSEDADWLLASENVTLSQNGGRQGDWGEDASGVNACKSAKAHLKYFQGLLDGELSDLRRHAVGELLGHLKVFVTGYAEERRNAGIAEFHDMLTWAVQLLEDDDARRHFQERYTYVLVDEFQDTDPLQVDLVRGLTDRDGAGQPAPGALFVVGDPKQSIYRFRHADLPTLNRLRNEPHVDLTLITENFRSNPSLVGWVNHVFARWMDGGGSPYQADYVALESSDNPPETEPRFGVHLAGEALPERRIEAVRRTEMADLSRVAREVGDGRWMVRDGDGLRASRYGDLCILIPRRTALPLLERALDEHEVPYTTAGNSLIFATEDIRDLLSALTAIDDPTDQVAVVAALRSPAYACSDVDLWRWARSRNGFNYLETLPGNDSGEKGPVARAFASLRTLHNERLDTSPGVLIERFVRERRLRELALAGGRAEERWSRIQIVAEMARRLADAGRPSLRDFVLWGRQQAERDVRAPDAAATEETDVVRVMTVHAAKGLEFPIVMLTGLNSGERNRPDNALFDYNEGAASHIGVRMGSSSAYFESGGFDALRDQERDAGKMENVRLMYVAATRARDHLIVSTYRKDNDRSSPAALIAGYSEDARETWSPIAALSMQPGAQSLPVNAIPQVDALDDPEAWEREHLELIRRMQASPVVAASSLHEPGELPKQQKTEDGQIEVDPWRRGRAASAIGRAVHAVLQDVDLGDPYLLGALSAKHARSHDVVDSEQEVLDLAKATLEAPVMRRAAEADSRGRTWRESYVSAPVGHKGVILEGYVDLLFEDDDGSLVIVDYKTDRTNEAAELYELQLGAYAAAVRRATGRDVSQAVLVFSRRAQEALAGGTDIEAAQRPVADLDQAADGAIRLAEERSSAG